MGQIDHTLPSDAPEGVLHTQEFFRKYQVWHQFARNPPVSSCRDAASRRERLGYVGIPLSDELRSYVLKAFNQTGQSKYVLLHCRGDRSISFDAVECLSALRGWRVEKAKLDELADSSIGYGLVNPFTADRILGSNERVLQIFDSEIVKELGTVGTMMTNAGDRTWAVEFDPEEVIQKLSENGAIVATISESLGADNHLSSIGILTGNAPESGGLLWRKLNEKHRIRLANKFRGDTSYPDVQVHSHPWMGLSMELSNRSDMIEKRVIDEVRTMSLNGADLIAFACNTTQYYGPMIHKELSATSSKFVSLADIVEEWVATNKNKTIFVAGIGYVTENSDWSAFRFLHSVPNVMLPNQHTTKAINDLAYQVKFSGVDGKTYQKFRALFRNVKADYCLLLLTELSLIFEKYPRSEFDQLKIVDSMDLYADSIIGKWFSMSDS